VIHVRTLFVPYKLVLAEKRPVTLEVTLKNRGAEEKLVSVALTCAKALSLNPGGFAKHMEKRIGKIKPGTSALVTFKIYAKPTTLPGEYPLELSVIEHAGESYDYVEREKRYPLKLRVV